MRKFRRKQAVSRLRSFSSHRHVHKNVAERLAKREFNYNTSFLFVLAESLTTSWALFKALASSAEKVSRFRPTFEPAARLFASFSRRSHANAFPARLISRANWIYYRYEKSIRSESLTSARGTR